MTIHRDTLGMRTCWACAAAIVIVCSGRGRVQGGIPAPDAILYGDVCVDGVRAAATSDVTVMACINCDAGFVPPGIGSYHMGDSGAAGNQYVLRLRLEDLSDGAAPATDAARVGNIARMYVRQGNAAPRSARTFLITEIGRIERADLQLGATVCDVPIIVSSIPPHGSVDARQPSEPSGANETGWDSLALTFNRTPAGLTASDFEATTTGGATPTVSSVQANGNVLTVRLSTRIPPGERTTIRYRPNSTQIRLGFLPGDVNSDGRSSALDIIALIDSLNNVAPRQPWQIDINRSGQTNAQDILREVDLLNGAGAFDVWNGRVLPN